MAEDTARAIGASGGDPVMIGGKEYTPRPLSLRQLAEVQRECLAQYRREYIRAFAENLDLLPEADRAGILRERMEEAARWDVEDLPTKYAYDHNRVVITDGIRSWLMQNMDYALGEDNPRTTAKEKRLTAAAMDSGMLTEAEYKALSKDVPRKLPVGYADWWITGCYEGMITLIWACFKGENGTGPTKNQIAEELGRNRALLVGVTRQIEELSVPAVGNG